ncbi:hypothetical protein J437_LFUL006078 [Ladona fulva]|uniref:Uncharacterized protein n=1 Tax=Ladona fulva TaxID=123851 RepID=A0A8K0K0P7_LADFU|nr:hypothetical protein J437_LFUL006078 [Ladona fulva]
MEMHSPCGTSPMESSDGYMPMSPGSGGSVPIPADIPSSKTLQSVMQEGGYVPMTPGHPRDDDGYVDMDPNQNASNKGQHDDGIMGGRGEMSPAASSCSVTSGTPSTDTRFSEYHLEKVSSYFTPSEEEEEGHGGNIVDEIVPMERPVRAYSVGSRPETLRKKNWLEVSNVDSMRVRAYSVGSRQGGNGRPPGPSRSAGDASHHSPHRQLPHHIHVFAPSPMAPNVRKGASSPKGTSSQSKKSSKSSSAPVLQALSSSWSGSSTLCSPPGSTPSPYSQASGSISSKQPMNADSVDHDLMELDFSGRGKQSVAAESTALPMVSKKKQEPATKEDAPYVPMSAPAANSDYQEMKITEAPPSSFSPPLLLSPPSAGVVGGKAPSSASSASSSVTLEEYVDMNFKKEEGGNDLGNANSGYMEMWPARKSSAEGPPGDYVNMDGGERSGRTKGPMPEASRPIAIRKERREDSSVVGGKESGRGSSPNFSLAGLLSRKSSSGTPPKGPFSETVSSPFSSLRRGRKKRGGEDEENEGGDEGSSHKEIGDLQTPTAIFPFSLNSPGSPVRPFPGQYESASKCPVDATSGTVHISYPYVPSSPVATAGSVMPSRAKPDIRRRSEYSVPGGGSGNSGSPPKRDSKRHSECPLAQSSSNLVENINTPVSTPSALSPPTSREYANYCPSPPKQGSAKPSVGSDDYMPMAPSGRVRKESVVSGPRELTAMAPSLNNSPVVTSSSSSLFSSFSPSASFSGSTRPKSLSDYVCMKALPSSSPALSSGTSTIAAPTQRVKSSSADYLEIKVGLDAHQVPFKPNHADDYVEIDLSQKPGVIVEKSEQKHGGGAPVSAPKLIPNVGAYVPSHTGFGFHPQFSSMSTSSSSSKIPPPPPASYTWPRKGIEMRKDDVPSANNSSSTGPTTNSNSANGGKTDDYVLMDLGSKSNTSSSSTKTHQGYKWSFSLTSHSPLRRYSTGITPPSTTVTVTATTTTTTSVTSSISSLSQSLTTSVASISSTPLSSTSATSLPPSCIPFSSIATHDSKFTHNSLSSTTTSQSLQATTATMVPLKEKSSPLTVANSSALNPTETSDSIATSAVVNASKEVTSADALGSSCAVTKEPSCQDTTITTVSSVTSFTASVTYSSAPVIVSAFSSPLISSFASIVACTSQNTTAGSASCTTSPSCAQYPIFAVKGSDAPVVISAPDTTSAPEIASEISRASSLDAPSTAANLLTDPTTQGASLDTSSKVSSDPQVTSPNSVAPSSSTMVTSAIVNTEPKTDEVCKDSQISHENSEKPLPEYHPSPLKTNVNQQKAQLNSLPSSTLENEEENKVQREKSDCVASNGDNSKDLSSDCCSNGSKMDNSHSTLNNESVDAPLSEKTSDSSLTEVGGASSRSAHRADSKRGRGGSSTREACRRNSADKTEGGHLPRRGSEERALGRGRGSDGSEVRGTRTRRRSSDVDKNKDTQHGCKLSRQGSGLARVGLHDGEDDSGSYEKLLVPGGRQQRKWQHNNSLGERTTNMGLASSLGPLRRQLSSPSAVPDPDGAYEKLLPTHGAATCRRRSGDKVGTGLLVGESIPTQVFSASSSSASSSSSLASVASSVLLGPTTMRSLSTSSPPPTTHPTAPPSPGEINYASLDLAPPSNTDTEDGGRCGRRSPRVFAGRSGAESPSTAGNGGSSQSEQPLNYAEIDFSKSIAPSVKNRVRH